MFCQNLAQWEERCDVSNNIRSIYMLVHSNFIFQLIYPPFYTKTLNHLKSVTMIDEAV